MDAYLIKKISEGDHDAFKEIFIQFFPKVKSFAIGIVKSESIAEELAQDIFLKLWINRKKLVFITGLQSYIYSMARNESLNYLRSKGVERKYLDTIHLEDISENFVENKIHANELELLIHMYLQKMPAQRRRVFMLSKYDGLSNAEIAEKLSVSKKTVENHLYMAIKELKDNILLFFIFLFFLK